MKKLGICLLVVLVALLTFAACDMTSADDATETTDSSQADTRYDPEDETNGSDTTETTVSAETETRVESETLAATVSPETETNATVSITEQVLFEENGVKVTAKAYKSDFIWGDSVQLLIENNSTVDVSIGCHELIVNNYMIGDYFSATVAAGKKTNEELDLSKTDLKEAGIETVGKIEAYFYLYNPETYETIKNLDCVTIQTSAYEGMEFVKQDEGRELVNQNGIRIVAKGIKENDLLGTSIVLFVENNTGRNVTVRSDDLSVNGFMIDEWFYATIYDGRMIVDTITLSDSSLEENDINSIEEIELKFRVTDPETYDGIFETEVIKYTVE